MKKIITTLLCAVALVSQVQAQTAKTVSMGANYGNNVWYSLESGNVGTAQPANNWDIALAPTISTSSPLITSVLFNGKQGTLFVAPESFTPVDNFMDLDTAGMANTWTKLYNDDRDWGVGAFNSIAQAHPNYGWGTYDDATHSGFSARRIFVIRYGNGSTIPFTYKKLTISMKFTGGTYTIKYDNIENTDPHTAIIPIADYNTKNFVYYSLADNATVDREPAASTWDLLFTQYVSISENYKSDLSQPGEGAANQLVGGVLLNQGVQAAQANNVEDQTTYQDYAAETFSSDINTIGWDWKYLNASYAWKVVSDTVFFVKRSNGDIYTLYFTSFGGTGTGDFNFTQEKLSVVTGLFGGTTKASLALYPNPSSTGSATVIYDFNGSSEALLSVADLAGNVMYTENMSAQAGLNTYNFPTTSLNPGMYIVSVNVNGGVLQQKLVVR